MIQDNQYQKLMITIRARLDLIMIERTLPTASFLKAETAALHGRKVIEALAFACITAVEKGIRTVPRDAKGQWNAEKIFTSLKMKRLSVFPSPARVRKSTPDEFSASGAKIVIEGIPERRMSHEDVITVYQRLHEWLHEVNPYVHGKPEAFYENRAEKLWVDLEKVEVLLKEHFISINGEAYFCVLRDKIDGKTKVQPLSKISELSDWQINSNIES